MKLIGTSSDAAAFLPRRLDHLKRHFSSGDVRVIYKGYEGHHRWGDQNERPVVWVADPLRKTPDQPPRNVDIACWISFDDHRHHEPAPNEPRLARASDFDIVFVSQADYGPLYVRAGAKSFRWLPHDVIEEWLPTKPRPAESEFEFDVSMAGRGHPGSRKPHQEREDVLLAIQKTGLRCWFGSGLSKADMLDLYRRSKMVINRTRTRDFNARITEATVAGALLLTDKAKNGFPSLFCDGHSCLTYETPEQAANLAVLASKESEFRERIAAKGKEIAMANLTADKVVERFAKAIIEAVNSSRG